MPCHHGLAFPCHGASPPPALRLVGAYGPADLCAHTARLRSRFTFSPPAFCRYMGLLFLVTAGSSPLRDAPAFFCRCWFTSTFDVKHTCALRLVLVYLPVPFRFVYPAVPLPNLTAHPPRYVPLPPGLRFGSLTLPHQFANAYTATFSTHTLFTAPPQYFCGSYGSFAYSTFPTTTIFTPPAAHRRLLLVPNRHFHRTNVLTPAPFHWFVCFVPLP